MPRLTAQDTIIRARWSDFLRPLVGGGPDRVSIPKLNAEVDKIAERGGDNRAEIYAYLGGTRTPRPERVFQIGEALRACGIDWCSGVLALYAAGHLGEWVDTVASIFSIPKEPARKTAVVLAVFVPLAVLQERNLYADLGDDAESCRAIARKTLGRALQGVSIEMLQSAFDEQASGLAVMMLEPIVHLARSAAANPSEYLIESFVLSALREWAFLVATPDWRQKIATVMLELQHLRTSRILGLKPEIDTLFTSFRASQSEEKP